MTRPLIILSLLVIGCEPALYDRPSRDSQSGDLRQLPTGAMVDPAGRSFDVGSMPLAIVLAPEPDRAVLVLSGWREKGLQVIRPSSGEVLQTLTAPAAFIAAAFPPDHRALYLSGGNQDVIYRYAWNGGKAAEVPDSIVLAAKAPGKAGTRYPAGLAFSPD